MDRVSLRRGVLNALCLALVLALLLAPLACRRTEVKLTKVVVVFLDHSGSVKDYRPYREAWLKLISRLRPGDRIVLSRITDQTYNEFAAVLDMEIPGFSPLKDNRLVFAANENKLRHQLEQAFDRAIQGKRSPRTDILSSLNLAEKVFKGDSRRRVLVLLCDMYEDSADFNFTIAKLTDAFVTKAVERRRKAGLLPDLGGAKVYVAGASADSARNAHAIEVFWCRYIEAANGGLAPQNYGPSLINFDE